MPSIAKVVAVWAERMMPRHASFGSGSSRRRNSLPGSDARKTCRLSGEPTRDKILSWAAAWERVSKYWQTAL